MSKRVHFYCTVIVCLSAICLLTGCVSVSNSPAARFYKLRAIEEREVVQKYNIPSDVIIGIGPVKIPEYLNRPQIVTVDEKGMLNFAQFERWGELLDLAIARTLDENLGVILEGENIQMYPWNVLMPVQYQVILDVIKLNSRLDKELVLAVQWSVMDLKNKNMAFTKRSVITPPILPQNYSGLTAALSSACATLSIEIAEELSALANRPQQ